MDNEIKALLTTLGLLIIFGIVAMVYYFRAKKKAGKKV